MLTNKIRSHFNTGYNIPKNCNLSQMKSEFSGGTLTIRIPRIIPAVQRTGPRELEAETSLRVLGLKTPLQDTAGVWKERIEETPSGRSFARKETEGKVVEAPANWYLIRVMMNLLRKLIYCLIPQKNYMRRLQG